ncbi:MAG: glycosyltransferase family 2 protein [Bacteroidota bacterium]
MTRNRRQDLESTLGRLRQLPEQPSVVVVDNGSTDGTPEMVRMAFPEFRLLSLGYNAGVAARNLAVRQLDTPYVVFNDDDSWWAPGSLRRVVDLFDEHPALGAVTAHVVVEPDGGDDPTSLKMQQSPLDGRGTLPGIPVLGFLACATATRREAFLSVGGFEERFHFGGEEQLLATDLAAAGWAIRYVPDVIVHHRASSARDRLWRHERDVRNRLWYFWLRRPAGVAALRSLQVLLDAPAHVSTKALVSAVREGSWVWRERSVVPKWLEDQLKRLDRPVAAESDA